MGIVRVSNTLTPSQIGLELGCLLEDHAWYLIQSKAPDDTLVDLIDTLTGAERPHKVLPAPTPKALLRDEASTAACLPTGTESWADTDFIELDRLRTAVREAWPVLIWIASPKVLEKLVHLSPNFAAFFQPSVGVWMNTTMTEEEAEARLQALRRRWEQSDTEVVALAEAGELQQDVDHHVWLILLGRGDLVDDAPAGDP